MNLESVNLLGKHRILNMKTNRWVVYMLSKALKCLRMR